MKKTILYLSVVLLCSCSFTAKPAETKYVVSSMHVQENGLVSYYLKPTANNGFHGFYVVDRPGKFYVNDTIEFMAVRKDTIPPVKVPVEIDTNYTN